MKKLLQFIFLLCSSVTFAQGTWTQKANFEGTKRADAVSFSIGTKGYIVTGQDADSLRSDFWEWDQATDTWTEKARFPGTARSGASGFSIGTKGYIGTGLDADTLRSDFWEWDQATDSWIQKANFGGTARYFAVGFSIGDKGYIGTGNGFGPGEGNTKDFWEYDPTTDIWTQKTDFGGVDRLQATGFSIGQKGYIIFGGDGQYGYYYTDFWEWDQMTDTWTEKNFIPAVHPEPTARLRPISFVIGTKGYVGTGWYMCGLSCSLTCNDIWEWNQDTETWTAKETIPELTRSSSVGFSIGDRGYIGIGYSSTSLINDLWEYCDDCTVNIDELDTNKSVSVFPNPASTSITLSVIEGLTLNTQLKIMNAQGQLVQQLSIVNYPLSIDISQLNPGLYYLTLQSNESVATKKFEVIR